MNTLISLNQVRLTSSVLTFHRHAAGAFLSVWDGPDHRVTCCNAVYEPTVYVLFEIAVCENSFTPCRCRLDLRLGRPLESLQHGRVLADEIAKDSSMYIKFLQGEGKESLGVCTDFFHKG